MDDIFDQIMGTLNAGFPYAAIALALSVPDICANLQTTKDASTGRQKARYLQWYRTNLATNFPEITEDDFYSLRNGVVHTGTFGSSKQYARIVFGVANQFGSARVDDLLIYETKWFCETIVRAAATWYESAKSDANVVSNIGRLVRPRKDGLRPYVIGMPLIG